MRNKMEPSKKSGLGRGLSSLFENPFKEENISKNVGEFDDSKSEEDSTNVSILMDISEIGPGSFQPRRQFEEEALESLAQSIRTHGILQPILIRKCVGQKKGNYSYEIIAGERRWRAAARAGLNKVPVIIQTFLDNEALRIALIENIQREDLTPIEEAEGYKRLIEEGNYKQEELANLLGKSRSHIANMLRLNQLPQKVKILVESKQLSMGHVRALLTTDNIESLAQEVLSKNLSVRETERLVQKVKGAEEKSSREKNPNKQRQPKKLSDKFFGLSTSNPDMIAIEGHLNDLFGLKSNVHLDDEETGAVVIHFNTLEELDTLLGHLMGLKKEE